jgi:hypothetical protein
MKPLFKKLIITSIIASHFPPITHHPSLITPSYAEARIEEIIRFDDNWDVQSTKVGDSTPLYFNSNGDLKIATPGMVSSTMTQLANAFDLPSIRSYINNWQSVALSVAIYALQSYFPSVKEAISSANYMANESGKIGSSIYKDTINLAHLGGKPVNITQACVVAKLGVNPFTSNTDEIQNAVSKFIASNGHEAYQKLVSECSLNGNLRSLMNSASIEDLRRFLSSRSLRKVIDALFTQKLGIVDNGISYAINSQNVKSMAQSGDVDRIGELLALAVTPEATLDNNGNLILKEIKDESGHTITPDWVDKQVALGIHEDFINNVFKPLEQTENSNQPMPLDTFLANVQQVYKKYGIEINPVQNGQSVAFNDDTMVKVYLQWYRYYEVKKAIEALQQQNADHSRDAEIIEKVRLASELYDLYTKSRDLAISIVIDEFKKKVIDSTYTYLNRAQAKAREMEKQAASTNKPKDTQNTQ